MLEIVAKIRRDRTTAGKFAEKTSDRIGGQFQHIIVYLQIGILVRSPSKYPYFKCLIAGLCVAKFLEKSPLYFQTSLYY